MRRLWVFVAAAMALIAASACDASSTPRAAASPTTVASAIAVPPGTPTAVVDRQRLQTIAGFGASGAWWPNDLARFPRRVQRDVARMLFSTHGIALSGYRYNIGGGGV